jgi:hypothetical protein
MLRSERDDQQIQSGQDNKPERHLAEVLMDQPAEGVGAHLAKGFGGNRPSSGD